MSFADLASNRRTLRIALVLLALAAVAGADRAWAAVTSIRLSRTTFSPNADGVHDSVRVAWTLGSAAESLAVEVRRSTDSPTLPALITLVAGPRPAGADSVSWDGRDSLGVAPPDGFYSMRVVERTSAGVVVSERAAAVIIDVTAPSEPRFEPALDGLDTTVPLIALDGVAPGADSVVVYVDGVPSDTLAIAATDSVFGTSFDLAEGPTAFALQSYDRAGNHSPFTLASTVTYRNTAEVSNFRVVPLKFSPNADGVLDSARVTFDLDAATSRLEVQIRRASPPSGITFADSVPFVRLFDGPAAAGAFAFDWVGLDSLGTAAPQASYFAFVQAESTTTGGAPAPGRPRAIRVELDVTPPSPPVLSVAIPQTTSRASLRLAGIVSGGDSVRVFRDGARVAQASSNFDLTITILRGVNAISLQGVDGAGNASAVAGPYFVVYDEVAGFHAPERFRRGDAFEVNLATSPSELRLELFTLEGRLLRTLVSSSTNPSQELTWNLLDERGREVGDGPCVARLTITYPDGRSEQTKAAVVVAK